MWLNAYDLLSAFQLSTALETCAFEPKTGIKFLCILQIITESTLTEFVYVNVFFNLTLSTFSEL